ncbi:MAG TPA: serine/threonine-protein kinase [Kofleriaceae bacterium]|nr:serine/threonine-protein kinase [Kofleriaceae bacterium]
MSPERPLARGSRVGTYEVMRHLGAGGMATVYAARAPGGQLVALKVLARELAEGTRAARFAREVATAARLRHPGCVRLLDHGFMPDGTPFLVTELLAGPTLRDALGRRFSIAEVLLSGIELCDALAHAHRAGVLHRDIKPENVMFRGPGRRGGAVLIDFGLSRLHDDAPLTAVGTCLGSPSYLAPERLLERGCDERADIYAMGCVLYELLAGRPPFVGDGPLEIGRQHVFDLPVPLRQRRASTPPALAAVVHRALEKDPQQRFARAETMAAALASVAVPRRSPEAGPQASDSLA